MKPDDQLIAEVRELDARATKGPWEPNVWTNFDEGGYAAVGPHHEPDDTDESREENIEPESPTGNLAKRDADFIAAARTLLPDLANRLEAALKEIEDAPHAEGCATIPQPKSYGGWKVGKCDCWKSRALNKPTKPTP